MTTAAIKEFVQFFRQFLDLCLSPSWPDDDTEQEEVIKALEIAHHVELSVTKMKRESNCFDKFLDLLFTGQNFSSLFLHNCMNDPPKFILKKVITSDASVNFIGIAFRKFQDLYSEDRVVNALSELMVEAASKSILLKNMSVLPASKMEDLKNELYLLVLFQCESDEAISDILKDCSQEMLNGFVLCLLKNNMTGLQKDDVELVRRKIIVGLTDIMICREPSVKKFWKLFFKINKDLLEQMCLKYKTLGEMAFEAIKDSYFQITQDLPLESCFTEFTEPELYSMCNKIFESETLKSEFIKYLENNGFDESCMPFL